MRFVVLDHVPPPMSNSETRTMSRHFDMMFEEDGQQRLTTFAIESFPKVTQVVDAVCLPDHRAEFLEYEGDVSGQRGRVIRFAEGTWSGNLYSEALLSFSADSPNFQQEHWKLRFDMEESLLFRIS